MEVLGRLFDTLVEKLIPYSEEQVWPVILRWVVIYVMTAFVAASLGFNRAVALMLVLPFIAVFVLVVKLGPIAVGLAGLADDLGLVALPNWFTPIQWIAGVISGFSDAGTLAQIATGTKEVAGLTASTAVSLGVSGVKVLVGIVKD